MNFLTTENVHRMEEIRSLTRRVGSRSQIQTDREDTEITSDKEGSIINRYRESSHHTEINYLPRGSTPPRILKTNSLATIKGKHLTTSSQ